MSEREREREREREKERERVISNQQRQSTEGQDFDGWLTLYWWAELLRKITDGIHKALSSKRGRVLDVCQFLLVVVHHLAKSLVSTKSEHPNIMGC